jgi:hypothetical protein
MSAKSLNLGQFRIFCEQCGSYPRVAHQSKNPNYTGYILCAKCAKEFDSRKDSAGNYTKW